jgi:hypothetical protein
LLSAWKARVSNAIFHFFLGLAKKLTLTLFGFLTVAMKLTLTFFGLLTVAMNLTLFLLVGIWLHTVFLLVNANWPFRFPAPLARASVWPASAEFSHDVVLSHTYDWSCL